MRNSLILAIVGLLLGFRTVDLIPLASEQPTIIPPTLVSAQALGADQAEIVVKAGFEFTPSAWQLTLLDASGQPLPLSAGAVGGGDLFNLTPYRSIGLTTGQIYRLRFRIRNAGGDSVRVERLYTHRPVRQYSLTQAAYQYWTLFEQQCTRSGTIFDPQPASIEGNVRAVDDTTKLALGFFGASGVSQ